MLDDLGFPSLSNMMRDFDRLGRVFDVQTNRMDRDLEWAPRADIIEEPDAFVVEAEIPGVPKENIKIDIEDDILTLSGEKSSRREFKDRGRVRTERSWGTFERRFVLPDNVDAKQIKANYDHGVLKLVIPKILEEQEGNKIEVKIE
jgi:HSP20 family protein